MEHSSESNGWRFEKKMSLDTIVAIVGVAIVIGGPLMLAWRGMENRVVVLETKQEAQSLFEKKREDDAKEQRAALAIQVKDMADNIKTMQISFATFQAQLQVFQISRVKP